MDASPSALPGKLSFEPSRLEAYLSHTLMNFRGPVAISMPPECDDGTAFVLSTPEGRFELRCAPRLEHAEAVGHLLKEFRILAALHRRNFPVAQPFILCEEPQVIGVPFFIMSRPEGRVLTDPSMPGLPRDERAALYDSMNATLARLHSFDPAELGLASLNRSQMSFSSQLQRWSESYATNKIAEIEEMEHLMAWLPAHLPPERPPRLIHGDFRLHKLVFHPHESRVIAVRDWGNSGTGDAIADAVYHFLTWVIPPSEFSASGGSLTGYNLEELGIPGLRAYAASYAKRCKLGGLPNLDVYFAYSLFRVASILQSIATKAYENNARSSHARLIASQVRPLAILGWNFAQRAK
jgi:aminoglycoside phosphotransferase (APT) family kinase protein